MLEAFIALKVRGLDKYNKALERIEEEKTLVDSRKITKGEFIANALKEPGCPYLSSSIVNDEIRNNKGLFYKVAA